MRALIAEDDPVSRRILQDTLEDWHYEVVVAGNGLEAWEVLQGENPPPLAILDWMMPGMSGVDICGKLRMERHGTYIYVLILTAKNEKRDIVAAMDAGADDYVSKPFDEQELRVRLRAGQRIVELQETLRFQATHDPLTGLLNHGSIVDLLDREIARAEREDTALGVIMADLDHFKRVNDAYGHLSGDEVLREASRRIPAALRPYDSVGRYGGEEFLIVLPGCDALGGVEVAERIRWSIASTPIRASEWDVPMTISLGVSVRQRGDHSGAAQLKKTADQALYRAKAAGRNRVEMLRLIVD